MYYMKIHTEGMSPVLAVCDESLLGKKLKGKRTTIIVSKSFYGGDLVDEDGFLSLLKNVRSANFIGNDCVDVLIRKGLIKDEEPMIIDGQSHVQIYDVTDERGR